MTVDLVRKAPNSNSIAWLSDWSVMPPELIAADPRYVAFRSVHDWVIVTAKVLADHPLIEADDHDSSSRPREDPFTKSIQAETSGEPIGLICGDPLERMHQGERFDSPQNFSTDRWTDIADSHAAIRFFHGWSIDSGKHFRLLESPSERAFKTEYMSPGLFVGQMSADCDASVWRNRSREEIENDPRYIAYRAGWDRSMIRSLTDQVLTRPSSGCVVQ
jgi:hypothetical protein